MRSESEKKTHSTSVRMSKKQFEQIGKNASEQNMTVSQYMVHAAVHPEQKLDPKTMVKIQNICNLAEEIAKEHDKEHDAEQADTIRKEVRELWSRLS